MTGRENTCRKACFRRLKATAAWALGLSLALTLAVDGCAHKWDYGGFPPEISAPVLGLPRPAVVILPPAEPSAMAEPTVMPQPAQREVLLGHSVRGRAITMQVFGDGPEAVLIFAAIHGDEGISARLAARLIEFFRSAPGRCDGLTVAVLPCANPDGLAASTRFNANGVDINRNFPASTWARTGQGVQRGGLRPASEPETLAIINAMEQLRPARVVSIHSIAGGRQCNNYDGPAGELARAMASRNLYPVKASIGYPTPGSFGGWSGVDRHIPTMTLELPQSLGDDECWAANREALLTAIRPPTAGK